MCCVRSPTSLIYSDKNRILSSNGHHSAVQIGDMVFDNLNPDGIPYAEWASDLGLNIQGFKVTTEAMTGTYNNGCINSK